MRELLHHRGCTGTAPRHGNCSTTVDDKRLSINIANVGVATPPVPSSPYLELWGQSLRRGYPASELALVVADRPAEAWMGPPRVPNQHQQ